MTPETQKRFTNIIGISRKAGKLICGTERTIKAIQCRKVSLVIMSFDASDKTAKDITDKCRSHGIRLLTDDFISMKYLGEACGLYTNTSCVSFTDKGLADNILLISKL